MKVIDVRAGIHKISPITQMLWLGTPSIQYIGVCLFILYDQTIFGIRLNWPGVLV